MLLVLVMLLVAVLALPGLASLCMGSTEEGKTCLWMSVRGYEGVLLAWVQVPGRKKKGEGERSLAFWKKE